MMPFYVGKSFNSVIMSQSADCPGNFSDRTHLFMFRLSFRALFILDPTGANTPSRKRPFSLSSDIRPPWAISLTSRRTGCCIRHEWMPKKMYLGFRSTSSTFALVRFQGHECSFCVPGGLPSSLPSPSPARLRMMSFSFFSRTDRLTNDVLFLYPYPLLALLSCCITPPAFFPPHRSFQGASSGSA